jgi:hypothetical protein
MTARMRQYFEELTREHMGCDILIRTHGEDGIKKWGNWDAKIYAVESNGIIVVAIGSNGAMVRLERDCVKLMR